MTMKVFYRRLLETGIIVSEVFTNMARNNELRDDWMDSESEGDTYAELTSIAEDIEDSMNETERDNCSYETIREMARERILKEYGNPKEVYTIEYIPSLDTSVLFKDTKNDDGDVIKVELLSWIFGKAEKKEDFEGHIREYAAYF